MKTSLIGEKCVECIETFIYMGSEIMPRRYTNMNEKIGYYAFLVGIVLAVIAGLVTDIPVIGPFIPLILLLLGLVVGFLNIGDKEVDKFLLAAIALALVGATSANLTAIPALGGVHIGGMLASIVSQIATFVAPAALIVALVTIWNLGKTPSMS